MRRLSFSLLVFVVCLTAASSLFSCGKPAPKRQISTVTGYLDEIIFVDTPQKNGAVPTYDATDISQPHYEARIDDDWYRLTMRSGLELKDPIKLDTLVTAEIVK
mgnify:CR=1 FL=1